MEKIPITSYQTIGFFLPGFIFTLPTFYSLYYFTHGFCTVENCMLFIKNIGIQFGLALIVISLVIGLVLDAFRNGILEYWFDGKQQINWDFFFEGDKDNVGMLYARYYTYYTFDVNLILALIISSIPLILILPCSIALIIYLSMNLLTIFVIARDAKSLRKDIFEITNKKSV